MTPWALMWRRIWAYVVLGWAFWRRQARRLIPGVHDAGGAPQFLKNYADEGMAPMSAADEAALRAAGACIHCGLCEAVCAAPVDRLLAYSRATQLAAEAAASLPGCGEGCGACEAICPTGVPLRGIWDYLAGRVAGTEGHLQVGAPSGVASTPASSAVSAPEP
ncbi:MAG: hypothetical protein KC613_00250 [Myxococcales bacterium]|nr:hypothetical protein [Myxococcales bacterium]MCB9526469.1 hypothetical protein [Myxococcales bacterium]